MISPESVNSWLQRYVEAWRRGDPEFVKLLFTPDAAYHDNPFSDAHVGHEAIIRYWEQTGDPPDAFDAHYEPVFVSGSFAAAQGWSRYYTPDRQGVDREYANAFLLWFADEERCREYREWYMKRPPEGASVDAAQ